MSKTEGASVGAGAPETQSGASAPILGVQIGRARECLIGAGALGVYLVFLVSEIERARRVPVLVLAIVAGPLVILFSTRMIASILRRDRAAAWLTSQDGDQPPPGVEGWHVSSELGIAIVSLRSGGTFWIDARSRDATVPLPAWLRGPAQWGRVRFWGRPMSIAAEWIAPAAPAAFAAILWSVTELDIPGEYPPAVRLLFIVFAPITGIVGFFGVVLALFWHPSMELKGSVASVLRRGEILASALRARVREPLSGRGRVELTGDRPSWRMKQERGWFRPVAVFSRKVRRELGLNEAEVIRRIIEERARPQGSVYRAQAIESRDEPNRQITG